ncbi:MAG: glycosyltransferase [Ilumatobacteraceae bacterium]
MGTFPPRPCGLATFTADVAASLRNAGDVVVVASLVEASGHGLDGATYELVQSSEESAVAVATLLSNDVDVVLIQHEFGIFDGRGSAVLRALTDNLTVPYVVTLHTVLAQFERWQVRALAAPLAGAALVFVFSDEAVALVTSQFADLASKCCVVPHAAPAALFGRSRDGVRERMNLAEHTMVISTFGLLSPSKGIEHVIRAMPAVRQRVSDVVYLVAGRTHPEVVRRKGERYRESLVALAHALGVDDIVRFRDWFHDDDELTVLLHATDLFVTPYSDAEQIVSGALSFAIAAGVPFVSTPYRYATGLARQGCGLTVPFGDDGALGDAVTRALTENELRHEMAARATAVSAARSWPQVGQLIHGLLDHVIDLRWAEVVHDVDRSASVLSMRMPRPMAMAMAMATDAAVLLV